MQFSSLLSAENASSSGTFSGLDYIAVFFLLLIFLFAVVLVAPFHLSLNFRKIGPLLQGSYRLAWLGLTLGKAEIMPQSAKDLLASIWKEKAGKKEQSGKEELAKNAEEKAREKKEEQLEKDDRNRSKIDSPTDNPKTGILHPPKIRSLVYATPALANFFLDLLKSILFKKLSCRLCFGLDDPFQTAIISGYLWSTASALGLFPAKIFIDPWFEGERLEGELVAEIEARLLWPVFAVIQAMRVKEIRLLLREMLGWA